jgi:hypothetical protein
MYVVHGTMLIITAWNLPLVLPIVIPFARLTIVLGGIMLWIDIAERMPIVWTLFETIALVVSGGLTEYLARRAAPQALSEAKPERAM